MKDSVLDERVLALDVRSHRLGYFCLETASHVVDFGLTVFTTVAEGGKRMESLMRRLSPTVLVLRQIGHGSRRDKPATSDLQVIAADLAQQRGIEVATVSEYRVVQHFKKAGAGTKYAVALKLAERFSELAWCLPPHKRKSWEPEHKRAVVFDAAALACVHLGQPIE